MAPDEARAEDVRACLQKAAVDLRAAEHETSAAEPGLWADVAFHALTAAREVYDAKLSRLPGEVRP